MPVIRCVLCGQLFSIDGNHSKPKPGMLAMVCPRCRAEYKGRDDELISRLTAISRSSSSMLIIRDIPARMYI